MTATLDAGRFRGLLRFNLIMGVLHAVSGTAMLVLGNDFALDVSTVNLNGPPGTPLADGSLQDAGSVPLAPRGYRSELNHQRNRFRWVEYSISSTLMIVLIALITGLIDLAALIAIAGVNASMILFGWIMEMVNTPSVVEEGAVWWTPFWFGCIAGATPWIAIAAYLWVNISAEGGEGPRVADLRQHVDRLTNCAR